MRQALGFLYGGIAHYIASATEVQTVMSLLEFDTLISMIVRSNTVHPLHSMVPGIDFMSLYTKVQNYKTTDNDNLSKGLC
jgi:hypothetical protein